MSTTELLRPTEHKNIPLDLIIPWHKRDYGVVEDKVLFWMGMLRDPKMWHGAIIVRPFGGGLYEQLTGHHRKEAVKRLGWDVVPCDISDYTEVEAQTKYDTDNNIKFTPTAGMVIGGAPNSVKTYIEAGKKQGEAREIVRIQLGLDTDAQLQAFLDMHEAIPAGTLSEQIRDLLDTHAAFLFWENLAVWQARYGEPLAVAAQTLALKKIGNTDTRQRVIRYFSEARKQRDAQVPEELLVHLGGERKTIDSRLKTLSNSIEKLVKVIRSQDDGDIAPEILDALRRNWAVLNSLMPVEEINEAETQITTAN